MSDTGKIYLAQGLRGSAYGFGAVLLSTTLSGRGLPRWQVGLVLGSMLAGIALLIGRFGNRIGRRRAYGGFYLLLGATGVVFAFTSNV